MRKIERFLISVLWVNVMLIIAMWFFNWFFGFSLASASHWHYLSELQVSGNVEANFYTAFIIFVLLLLGGLYLLIFPWHRKIKISGAPVANVTPVAPVVPVNNVPEIKTVPSVTDLKPEYNRFIEKPPKLNLNNVFVPTMAEKREINNSVMVGKMQEPTQESKSKIKNLMAQSGLITKEIEQVDKLKLDFCAIGSNDVLLLGIMCNENGIVAGENDDAIWRVDTRSFKSPTSQIIEIKNKVKTLFSEVLDDSMEINILPFVFVDGSIVNYDSVKSVWDKIGVGVFTDTISLGEMLSSHKLNVVDDDEKSEVDAFSEFIDTVIEHFKDV
jgi:hypothetical protein